MELHFVATENVFVSYPYLKKVRSAPVRYVHASLDDRFHEIGSHGTAGLFADSSFAVV
jgi:hypothetical protein